MMQLTRKRIKKIYDSYTFEGTDLGLNFIFFCITNVAYKQYKNYNIYIDNQKYKKGFRRKSNWLF